MTERWLPIAGYEGFYEVSDLGRVRSFDREIIDSAGRTQRRRGRILKASVGSRGRLTVTLSNGRKRTHAVHVLVARAFHGSPTLGQEACHGDGDCTNNEAGNLRWGTHRENVQDSVRHGTHNMASRTHCPQDHEYTDENTYVCHGKRNCIKCRRIAVRRYSARKRAA